MARERIERLPSSAYLVAFALFAQTAKPSVVRSHRLCLSASNNADLDDKAERHHRGLSNRQ
jgi:hypothetical protein